MMKLIKRFCKCFLSLVRKPLFLIRHNHYGRGTIISKNVFMHNTRIGRYCFVGPFSTYNDVVIGNYCSLSSGVQIGGMEHSYWEMSTSTRISDSCISGKGTTLGNDVWIGASSIIRQGITIGDGAVIGANSFVNKDIPPYAIVFGNPAKVYKFRFDMETIKRIEESQYWKYAPREAREIIKNLAISD